MRWKMGIPLLVVAGLALAACGSSNDNNDKRAAADTAPAAATAAAPAFGETVSVKTAKNPIGDILVGTNGMTLYGFKNDVDSKSTCNGACADAWPPVIVSANWTVGPELDNAIFSTTKRDDGSIQLAAGRWPLYYFSGDAVPGDTKGQGSGDVWFVAGKDAKLIDTPGAAAAATPAAAQDQVKTASTKLGDVLVDANGHTLYGLTKDANGTPTCNGACADAWPPLVVNGAPAVASGLDGKLFTTVNRSDGSTQLKAGKWPLYRFAGDQAQGDVNGQGSGGVWFAVRPDGTLIK
jgi:predicted lipoprotein with Yx(FWY)xxD motif